MQQAYLVKVLGETMERAPRIYCVRANTANDAMQIAFALDDGFLTNEDREKNPIDASDMLVLAQSYCEIVHVAAGPTGKRGE